MKPFTTLTRRSQLRRYRQLQVLLAARMVNFINWVAAISSDRSAAQAYVNKRCVELETLLAAI